MRNLCTYVAVTALLSISLLACGSSGDEVNDVGSTLLDIIADDESSSIPDEGFQDIGGTVEEDVPMMMRDGSRPPRRSDVQVFDSGSSVDSATGPMKDGGSPVEDTTVPVEDTASPAEDTAVPAEDTASPAEDTASPAEDTASPVEDTAVPVEDTASPVEDTASPVEDTASPVEDTASPVEDTASPVEDTASPVEDTASPVEDTASPVEDTAVPVEDTWPPPQGPCGNSSECPNGVCVGGLCFYPTDGTDTCEEVVLCMDTCGEDGGCTVDCLNEGDELAQVLYADLWLCWVTSESFLDLAESCASKAADCYYETDGDLSCAQAYECTFDCDGQFACVDDCYEQATDLAQTLYTGLAYCLQGACQASTNPQCKVQNMMPGGLCHSFADLCGNVPEDD